MFRAGGSKRSKLDIITGEQQDTVIGHPIVLRIHLLHGLY